MDNFNWAQSLKCAVTVCDTNGVIVYMNEKAEKTFDKWGGKELKGKNLFDCHSPRSTEIIMKLIENNETNTYTIEKNGVKKLIYQTPWHINGKVAGMVELSMELPQELPHFIR